MKSTAKPRKKRTRKSKRTALYILLIFIAVQLLPVLFVLPVFNYFTGQGMDFDLAEAATSGWLIFWSMGVGCLVALFFILRDKNFFNIWKGKPANYGIAVLWGVLGFFMLLLGQTLAAMIEMAIGIEPGSENTSSLVTIAKVAPVAIVAVVLFGPILEELVFRRVIFGSLNQTTNFFFATAVSALVFALVHVDFTHLLLYFATGLILAFLYQHTKRIITPIIAHILLNGYVMVINLNIEKIENFLKQLENMQ